MVGKRYSGLVALIFFSLLCLSFASALTLSGVVYDINGNVLNNTNISVGLVDTTISWTPFNYSSNTSNASGNFVLSLPANVSYMYQLSLLHRNSTTNAVDYVGQSLPSFPYAEFSQLTNVNFYMQEAGTINVSVRNSSNSITSNFAVQIKDTKLGYPVSCSGAVGTNYLCYVPKNRNYSIMIYPSQGGNEHFIPVSFNWNNFSSASDYNISALSSYNATKSTLNKQFNVTESFARITGYVQNTSGSNMENITNFTIVPFLLEPGNMIFMTYGILPWNASAWNQQQSDEYNLTSGWYNITVPYAPAETVNYLLFAAAQNGSFYGGYRNISVSGSVNNFNFSMYGLLGANSNITMSNSMGGSSKVVYTKRQNFYFINATNSTITQLNAHIETKVDYSSYGAIEFTFMEDVSGTTSSFSLPLLNISGFKEMSIYSQSFSPKTITTRTASQIMGANGNNITLKIFRPEALDGQSGSSISVILYKSNSSCDVPNPASSCLLENSSGSSFSPLSAVIGGGRLSFRMGIGNVLVHYVNVDMLASGPPDALFEDNADVNETRTNSFAKIMKFGGQGPKIYDYILVSMPYTEGNATSPLGLDESRDINMRVPLLYDENWNVIWNVTANGTNPNAISGNHSHYSGKETAWGNLTQSKTCTRGTLTNSNQINETNPCYVDTANNKIWIRIPHFSGTGPEVSGQGYSDRYVQQDGITFLNGTETNEAYLNRNYIWINVTSNLTNFANITVYLYNSTRALNLSTTNTTYSTLLVNFSNLPDGLWWFNATALNSSSFINSTSTRNITIDTTYPTITNISAYDANNSIINRNNIFLNISSYDLNFKNLTIRLYNSSLSLINSSSNISSNFASVNHSINFTGLSDVDGLYYYDAIVYDKAENSNSTSLRQVILNVSLPIVNSSSVSVGSTTSIISFTSNKTVNATVSYGTSSALGTSSTNISYTPSGTISLTGLSASTTYYYNLTICDRAGNCVVNGTNTFTTSAAATTGTTTTTSGSSGTLDGWYVTYSPTVSQLSSAEGYKVDLINKGRVAVKIGSETHHVGVVAINSSAGKVTINVSSTPQQAVFLVGEEKKFDVTNDGYYDILVKLDNIAASKANLIIKTINEKMPSSVDSGAGNGASTASNTGTGDAGQDTESGKSWDLDKIKLWIYIAMGIIILVIIVYLILYNYKKKKLFFGY